MKPKIYSYYESVQLRPQDEQFACANVWKSTWEAQGWDPVMLNRSHAQGSPLHLKLMTKLTRLAPVLPNELQNNFAFICARFSRWCALHAAGGGWMSDYDVANISFCKKAMDAGHQPHIDLGVPVFNVGIKAY